jgi:hypothetical protein
VLTFTVRGVFIGVNGTSTDLERSVWCQVVAGWPAGWSVLHRLGLLLVLTCGNQGSV